MRNFFFPQVVLAAVVVAAPMSAVAQDAMAAAAPVPAAAAAATTAAASKLTFDVATVRHSAPLDMAKVAADFQAGKMPDFGAHIDKSQARYTYMSLRELMTFAYKVKAYQITGPDWLDSERFDIVAKLPDGTTKDDAPAMLKNLLEERFKLVAHKDTAEHPVLGLLVGKSGPKLKEASGPGEPIDENAPLKPGQSKIDTADGPAIMTINPGGTVAFNMGTRGTFTQRLDAGTQTMIIEGDHMTMSGFADMMTQIMTLGGGGGSNARQIVDMTGLKGNYQVSISLSLPDLMAMARERGMDIPGAPAGGNQQSPGVLPDSDPSGGGTTVVNSVQALGLKLEPRKAPVEQLVVEHAEKTPTEN